MRNTLIFAICAIIVLVVLYFIWPSDLSGELEELQSNELILKDSLKTLKRENKTLKAKDSVNAQIVQIQRDSVSLLKKSSQRQKVVYLKAREATDLSPDSTNLALEVKESRIMIDTLETHVTGLERLVDKLDARIASQVEIISNQDIQLGIWETRFKNLESLRDIQVEKERNAKRKWRAGTIGSSLILVLVLI